jgi:prolyl-tRNA editing enzyme YbaK/EbsC (Cys-tRNA(Pro) deacylase)
MGGGPGERNTGPDRRRPAAVLPVTAREAAAARRPSPAASPVRPSRLRPVAVIIVIPDHHPSASNLRSTLRAGYDNAPAHASAGGRAWSDTPMSPASDTVARALTDSGVTGTIRRLDSSARTAALAAEQLGVPVGAIANSLVFNADGEPLLVLTSGAHRVDTALLATTLGVTRVNRADAEFVRRHTGQPIGGVAPVGHPVPLRTVVDVALAGYPQLWAAAGHPHTVFPTSYAELVRITGGSPAVVAPDEQPPGTAPDRTGLTP